MRKKNFFISLVFIFFAVNAIFAETKKNNAEQFLVPSSTLSSDEAIKQLNLAELEGECGGFFKEFYRSNFKAEASDTGKQLAACSMIYHLIRSDYVVPWHKISSDEIFIFLSGTPQIICYINENGELIENILGNDYKKGEVSMVRIPANCWMSEVLTERSEKSWSLLGLVVVPGFDISNYAHGKSDEIIKTYPNLEKRIKELGLGSSHN